ncbi:MULTISPECIES: hypothetical protein [Mesorhizobium]|uniref:hypothetical protein n=1 Tax=Mesorhizobium TaxID=68287 RepID=UPI00267F4E20
MAGDARGAVIENFPAAPGRPNDAGAYLGRVDDVYVTDAYHSLSIEGYRVSLKLIDRVRSGTWNPDFNPQDGEHRDALAARGYYQAFEAVKRSVASVLANENPGRVVDEDHGGWYRELFAPSVAADIVKSGALAGYRSERVFIAIPCMCLYRPMPCGMRCRSFLRCSKQKSIRLCASSSATLSSYTSTPLYGWERSHGAVFDERHDGGRQ